MSISRAAARSALVVYLLALAWMLGAPVAAGPVGVDVQPISCPKLVMRHGIGPDLRTFTRVRDLCSGRG